MFAASKTDGSSELPDPQFNYVTMLLHGDGTNGAQNNTFLDSGPNTFTITRNGNTTQGSFSPYGSNWSFNNPDAIGGISVPTSTALDLGTGDFTIEAWVNTSKLPTTNAFQTSSGGYQNIFGTGPDSNPTGTSMYIGVTNLKFEITADGSGPIDVAHNMVAGVWYHIAVSRSGTTFRAFINGSLVQTGTSSASANNGYGWGIMRSERIGGSAFDGAWWFGYVSNFRVVKGTAVYTSAFTPPTAPLTAISGTSLLTCQSNRFIDTSSTAATVTVAGSTSVQRFNPFGTSTAYSTSVIGGSGYFDGTTDYLTVSQQTALSFGTGDFSIEAWVYPQATIGFFGVIDARNSGAGSGNQPWIFGLSDRTGYKVELFLSDAARYYGSITVPLNCWTHIAVSRVSGTLKSFVNGVVDYNASMTSAVNANGTTQSIGRIYDPAYTTGYITDVRVVKGSGYSSLTVPTAPLTAITNTQLLLNTTNGAIFDNAMMNDLETVGNAQISTSVKKYGTGSISLSASGNTLRTQYNNPSLSIGTGNFTIEGWVYFSSTPSTNGVFQMSGTSGGFAPNQTANLALATASSSTWQIYAKNTFTTSSSTTITVGSWIHFALVRSGTTTVLYINGTALITLTSDSTNYSTPYIGLGAIYDATSYPLGGYIDDLRITKGFARYTATFTPPTSALSDTGPY